jgi:alginate O-acetyltransferase complex protein AlgI
VRTEITDNNGGYPRGLVLYDGDCRVCTALAARFERQLQSGGFELAALQGPRARAALGAERLHAPDSMRVVTREGRVLEGADGVVHLAGAICWARPLQLAAKLPFAIGLLRRGYGWFAARRHCLGGACERQRAGEMHRLDEMQRVGRETHAGAVSVGASWPGWVPLAVLPAMAWFAAASRPGWVLMWALAAAVFAGCKWWTWFEARPSAGCASAARNLGYLLAWPGMDAAAFLANSPSERPARPAARQWAAAAAKTAFGAGLLWGGAGQFADPIAAGWCGLLGLIFVLHFGLFHLLALGWQRAGVRALPLMDNPLLARSLSEFWGKRWNSGFRQLSFEFVFQPSLSRLGRGGATLLAFAVSGLLHDVVISAPARGGYGLPTAYFLLQGCGVLVERSALGARLGVRRGWCGWAFAALLTAGPAYWLFHPPFVARVALPFLEAIHAL